MGIGLLGDRRRWAALLILVASIAVLVSACGGSDSDTGATSANTEETSGEEAGGNDVVAQAEEIAGPYFEPPASIGNEVPLEEKPPTGLRIVVMSCELTVCEAWRKNVGAAADKLGWSTKEISFSGAPEDNLNKVNQAVSEKPDAIIINGIPRETYEAAAEAAAKAEVPIVTQMGELEGEPTEPFIAVQYGAKQFDTMAEATANWMIMDSNGEGNALALAYAQFPLSERITDTTVATIDSACPDCSTKELLVQAEDTGTKLPTQIVSELQRDPSIDYVILQDMAMAAGVEAALREAGLLDKVNVMGNNVTPESIKAVQEGAFLGNMAFSLLAAAYQAVDAVARYVEDMPQQEEVPLMNQIFTQENLPAEVTEATWQDLPPTLEQEYEELWQLK